MTIYIYIYIYGAMKKAKQGESDWGTGRGSILRGMAGQERPLCGTVTFTWSHENRGALGVDFLAKAL